MDISFKRFSYYNKQIVPSPLCDVLDYHDITFCLSGTLLYKVDGKETVLNSGDCIYIKPGSKRYRYGFTDEKAAYMSINIDGPDEPLCPFVKLSDCVDKSIIEIIEMLNTAYLTRNFDKFRVLTEYIVYDLNEKFNSSSINLSVRVMENYIQNHIFQKLTLSSVAKSVHLSKEYCESMFKKETGMTIITYINREKVEHAKHMLRQDEMSLTEISELLGYSDYNYFARVFCKYTGKTPLQYRKLK